MACKLYLNKTVKKNNQYVVAIIIIGFGSWSEYFSQACLTDITLQTIFEGFLIIVALSLQSFWLA